MSDDVLMFLCRLLMVVEAFGNWSTLMHLVLIALLPKPDGGRRPIGLLPTIIRIWMRARENISRAREVAHYLPGSFGGPGRGAQGAAWQAAFRAETAAQNDAFSAQSLLDLVKAFEKIPHE